MMWTSERFCTVCNAKGNRGRVATFVATAGDGLQWFECGAHEPLDNVAQVERVSLQPIEEFMDGVAVAAGFAQSADGDACIEHPRQVERNPKAEQWHLLFRRRRSDLIDAAIKLAKHWRDQDGVNAYVIDELEAAARLYEVVGDDEFGKPCVECSECTGAHHWQEYVGYACKHCEVSAPVEVVEQLMAEHDGATCRVCGCTDEDCSQCIEKTGEPCRWVEADLCSACAGGAAVIDDDIIPCYGDPRLASAGALAQVGTIGKSLDALHSAMRQTGFTTDTEERLDAYEATKRSGEGD